MGLRIPGAGAPPRQARRSGTLTELLIQRGTTVRVVIVYYSDFGTARNPLSNPDLAVPKVCRKWTIRPSRSPIYGTFFGNYGTLPGDLGYKSAPLSVGIQGQLDVVWGVVGVERPARPGISRPGLS